MFTIALCEDKQVDAEKIIALVKKWGNLQTQEIRIRHFTSPYDLLEAIDRNEVLDIFVLDILMPEMDGIRLGKKLQQMLVEPVLIYLTVSEDYYADAFSVYAFQYLCKPLNEEKLFEALSRAILRCEQRYNDVFSLKTPQGLVQIPIHTIVYAELCSHVCHVHLKNGECLHSLYLRSSFDNYIVELLQHERFVKTHTAFIVNLDFVSRLTANSLTMTTGVIIPITRAFSTTVQRRYIAYGLREESERIK